MHNIRFLIVVMLIMMVKSSVYAIEAASHMNLVCENLHQGPPNEQLGEKGETKDK